MEKYVTKVSIITTGAILTAQDTLAASGIPFEKALQPIKERTQTKAKTDPIKFFIQSHSFAKFKFDNSFIIHIDEKTERSSKL